MFHHPYQQEYYNNVEFLQYGIAPQTTVYDPSVYTSEVNNYSYDCGNNAYRAPQTGGNYWTMNDGREYVLSNSSTPDTINSDLGYNSATSPLTQNYSTKEMHGGQSSKTVSELDNLCATLKTSDLSLLNKVFLNFNI